MTSESKTLIFLVVVLLVFGLLVLSSAGIVESQKKFDTSYYFLNNQIFNGVIPGLLLFFLLSVIDYKRWKKLSVYIVMFSTVLLAMVLLPSFGYGLKGATRWLSLGWVPIFQPSELVKLSVIIYLAAFFSSKEDRVKDFKQVILPFLVFMGVIGALILKQPDMGTFITIGAISLSIYFFAGAKIRHILAIIVLAFLLAAPLIALEPYRLNRIKSFVNPRQDVQGISYQLNQAKLAIGSGGIFGAGFGKSVQKFKYLPEPATDSIFAVLTEELGLVGAFSLFVLFIFLILTLVKIAKKTADNFGMLVVMGVAVWISAQVFINIGGITGIIPITGITLPFISYGGTSIVTILAALGIVLNISRSN